MVGTPGDDTASMGIVTTRVRVLLLALWTVTMPVVALADPRCSVPSSTGRACDDGDPCTRSDVCDRGACGGEPIACSDRNVCNGAETCDPASGACRPGPAPVCDDGDPCTIDEPCDPTGGCVIRRLPAVDFVRCRAEGRLPLTTCSDALPRRVRRPLVRIQRVLARTGRITSKRQEDRVLARVRHACERAKRRLDVVLERAASACAAEQRRALDDLCPNRQVVADD